MEPMDEELNRWYSTLPSPVPQWWEGSKKGLIKVNYLILKFIM